MVVWRTGWSTRKTLSAADMRAVISRYVAPYVITACHAPCHSLR